MTGLLWMLLACGGGEVTDTAPPPTVELECLDGIDEDQDGDLDCDDADCAKVPDIDGACTNPKDLRKYEDFDANAEWNRCVPGPPFGAGCGTDEDCNTECLSENTGISEDCSRCFAELVSCFIGSCAAECAVQPPTAECGSCVEANCVPAYETCFGTLACPFEHGCRDTVDNDGDGQVDGADEDCQ